MTNPTTDTTRAIRAILAILDGDTLAFDHVVLDATENEALPGLIHCLAFECAGLAVIGHEGVAEAREDLQRQLLDAPGWPWGRGTENE